MNGNCTYPFEVYFYKMKMDKDIRFMMFIDFHLDTEECLYLMHDVTNVYVTCMSST